MDDLTNRILAVGFALIGIFLIFLVILMAWGAPDESIDMLFDLAGYVEDHNNTEAKLIITFGGIILMLLATLMVIFEVVPPESNALIVTRAITGDAQIDADEVVLRIEEELRLLPQISQVQATVTGRGKKTEVELSLHVTSDADLAATVDEACQRTRALMEDRMGLELSRPPKAEIHYRELRVGQEPSQSLPVTSPATPPPAPSSPSAATPISGSPPPSDNPTAGDKPAASTITSPPPPSLPESNPSATSDPGDEAGNEPKNTTETDRPADA